MSDKAWVQFLLVAVPVMSLVGSWLALRAVSGRRGRGGALHGGEGGYTGDGGRMKTKDEVSDA
ncbi:MAG: hypothetical protein EYC67_07720 [Betaproteobacteria bacterium]|nr:MAG: hypothetical protein EYC67_07720 [Betaproteobacteria bacterium]